MATIDGLIDRARYDLRDTDKTLFKTDNELIVYANRGLRQLDNVLSAMKSDWVYTEADVSLLISRNYATAPTNSIAIRSAWIDTTELIKQTPEFIYRQRKAISSSGAPFYFAELRDQMIFDSTSDKAYTVKTYYDKRTPPLVAGATLPYNDEFDALIREMIVLMGHRRNENDVATDAQIYNFFYERMFGNVLRRNHVKPNRRLDF
jgi:hypothetical protein